MMRLKSVTSGRSDIDFFAAEFAILVVLNITIELYNKIAMKYDFKYVDDTIITDMIIMCYELMVAFGIMSIVLKIIGG